MKQAPPDACAGLACHLQLAAHEVVRPVYPWAAGPATRHHIPAVFLDARSLVGGAWLSSGLTFFVVTFSLLMLAPVRYPKLTRARWAPAAVVLPVVVMPFFGTRVLRP